MKPTQSLVLALMLNVLRSTTSDPTKFVYRMFEVNCLKKGTTFQRDDTSSATPLNMENGPLNFNTDPDSKLIFYNMGDAFLITPESPDDQGTLTSPMFEDGDIYFHIQSIILFRRNDKNLGTNAMDNGNQSHLANMTITMMYQKTDGAFNNVNDTLILVFPLIANQKNMDFENFARVLITVMEYRSRTTISYGQIQNFFNDIENSFFLSSEASCEQSTFRYLQFLSSITFDNKQFADIQKIIEMADTNPSNIRTGPKKIVDNTKST